MAKAFADCGLDPDFYATRPRSYDEVLPWDHVNVGVSREFLKRENERALKARTTPYCREGCINCGITELLVEEFVMPVIRIEFTTKETQSIFHTWT